MPSQLEINLSKVPELCYCLHPHDKKEIIIVKRGEKGYYKTKLYGPTAEATKATMDELNEKLGVTPQQRRAMYAGSLFGWEVPGADADNDCNKDTYAVTFLRWPAVGNETLRFQADSEDEARVLLRIAVSEEHQINKVERIAD